MNEQPNHRRAKVILAILTPFIWLGCFALLALVYLYAGLLAVRDRFERLSVDRQVTMISLCIAVLMISGPVIGMLIFTGVAFDAMPEPNPVPDLTYAICGGSEWTCNQYKLWWYINFTQYVVVSGLVVAVVCISQMVKRVYRYSRWAITARRSALQGTTGSGSAQRETQSRPIAQL